MKKIYYDWANVALKAKRAIGSSVIIETGIRRYEQCIPGHLHIRRRYLGH